MRLKPFAIWITSLTALVVPSAVAALETRSFTLSGLNLSLFDILQNVVGTLTGWVVGVCITIFLVGAFLMVVNAGKEERAKQGKTLMTGSVVGLVIALLAYAIVRTVFYIIF